MREGRDKVALHAASAVIGSALIGCLIGTGMFRGPVVLALVIATITISILGFAVAVSRWQVMADAMSRGGWACATCGAWVLRSQNGKK